VVGVQRIMLMKLYMLAAEYLVFSMAIKSPFLGPVSLQFWCTKEKRGAAIIRAGW